MDEAAARDVLLVKAIETADQAREVLSDDDRRHASRSARELAQWDATERGQPLTPALFLQRRAAQILTRLAERKPAAAAFFETLSYSNKRRFTVPLDEAKTPETRQRRLDKAVENLSIGKL